MSKLIDAFKAAQNEKTAKALVRYLNKHMMAECMATIEDAQWIQKARAFA
jgi:hypothetical protein